MERVEKPALLKSLFVLESAYSAQEISYTKIMGQMQDAGNTVIIAHYLDLLAIIVAISVAVMPENQ